MTIPIDKKAWEKNIKVLLFKFISATDLAQRLCWDHTSQAKWIWHKENIVKIRLNWKNDKKQITYFSKSTFRILEFKISGN